MTKDVVELTEKNFDKTIAKGNWIIDFWASWCGPCRMMGPEFEAAAADAAMKGKVNFAKVNVEDEQELASRFQVLSIPTILFFKNKEQVDRTAGAMLKADIIKRAKHAFA